MVEMSQTSGHVFQLRFKDERGKFCFTHWSSLPEVMVEADKTVVVFKRLFN